MWQETNPETACCDNLYIMAARHGVFTQPASAAEGYAKLSGIAGSAIPGSLEISTSIGTFIATGTVPLTMPANGEVVIRIRALVPGSGMNAAGTVTTGSLTTPAPGIDSAVVICGGSFCGGKEAEDCEMFRKRYLERLAYQPRATQAWLMQKIAEFPCVTRVCVREGSCCRCDPNCTPCNTCESCGKGLGFYVMFDDAFPCGLAPENILFDINQWVFGEHPGYGEGQVEIGVCGQIYRFDPLLLDIALDILGCPTAAQKQQITDGITALFKRICPSMPFRMKQIELIVANIIGPEIQCFVTVSYPEYPGSVPPRCLLDVSACGDLEPQCDVQLCLGALTYLNIQQAACA
jgi:uncharacterized phage protein gp47/JayE